MNGNQFDGGNGFDNNGFNEEDYAFRSVSGRQRTRTWALVSFGFGILSLATVTFGYTSLFFGIFAVILSIISRRNLGYFDGMSVAGLVLGIIGFVFGVAYILLVFFAGESFFEGYGQFFEQYGGGFSSGNGSDI